MAGRKGPAPEVRRKLVEGIKDVLIVALTCSALVLAWQTPIASQFQDWMREPPQTAAGEQRQRSEALAPYLAAVRNQLGLYGVSYDNDMVDRVFSQLSPLLGEGLSTAEAAEPISQRQWRALLEQPGFYCAFQGAPSLGILSAWLGQGGQLSGDAQELLLCWDGKRVYLCWRNGESYFRSGTQVVYGGHLDEILGGFTPNGAAFAYTLAQEDGVYENLDPYVLVSMTAPQPQSYTVLAPDFVSDSQAREQLLELLGFQLGEDSAYQSAGEMAINDSGDRVRLSAGGTVTFHAGGGIRYGVPSAREWPTAGEAAQAAWDLLNQLSAPWKGECSFVLSGVEQLSEGWTVSFQSRLEGVPVLIGEDGCCARFTIKGKGISDFTLWMRTYTGTGSSCVVPGERLAAAALNSLPRAGGRLILCYREDGNASLSAGWVADENQD